MFRLLIITITAAVIWGMYGYLISIICFGPVASLEALKANADLARAFWDSWTELMGDMTYIWFFAGVMFGAIAHFLCYGSKNSSDIKSGEKKVWILGAVIGVGMLLIITPLFDDNLIRARIWPFRLFFGMMQIIPTTIPILPISRFIFNRYSARRY